jgi:hypothetical protein
VIIELLLVTATFRPAAPTVGDLVHVEFAEAVVLDASKEHEVVKQEGRRVVVRTFLPEPIKLSGTMGNIRFSGMEIPVRSVLEPNDEMRPAPLKPPAEPGASKTPLVAIASAAALAALAWLAVVIRARRRKAAVQPEIVRAPADEFRFIVESLRRAPHEHDRWAALADATRRYIAAIEPRAGLELTTAEFLRVYPSDIVRLILRQGDLEKFSPWGAAASDFDLMARRALDLVPREPVEEAA